MTLSSQPLGGLHFYYCSTFINLISNESQCNRQFQFSVVNDPICSITLNLTRSGLYSQDLKDAMAPLQMNRFFLDSYLNLVRDYPHPTSVTFGGLGRPSPPYVIL